MPEIQSMVIDDEMAKALSIAIVRLCFRETRLGDYHSGEPRWSDLRQDPHTAVIHSGGTTPVDQVRRFTAAESHAFRREAANALYTILLNLRDPDYLKAVVNFGQQGLERWGDPKLDPELQVVPSHGEARVPEILLGDWMSAKLAFGMVKTALDCEEMSALESGIEPLSQANDQLDIRIVYKGRDVPWSEVGRISDDELEQLIKRLMDRVYTVLKQLHDGKFLVIVLRLGAAIEAQEDHPRAVPTLASGETLRLPF
ncbi:hypothetical protein [Microvirga sesbaniae]|uniref:hypothetical protein n=1 Tax=Microvirga sesbaniae TaxID=681392 RepID=UPI0021C745BA|nr:hypothetical protein [Microvirga sp. HBU67692]